MGNRNRWIIRYFLIVRFRAMCPLRDRTTWMSVIWEHVAPVSCGDTIGLIFPQVAARERSGLKLCGVRRCRREDGIGKKAEERVREMDSTGRQSDAP